MRLLPCVAMALLAPTAASAAVIQTGVFDRSHASTTYKLGVQPGGTYRVDIAVDKRPGFIDGEYNVRFTSSNCLIDPNRSECAPNDETHGFRAVKVNDLLWTTLIEIPALGSAFGRRYLYAITDFGGFSSGIATDQESADNYPINYTITATAIPEPATWALLIAGFGAAGVGARRRRGAPLHAL